MDEPESQPTKPLPVDPRILEAHERTLLAWIRTGIALAAFGFVVARLGLWLRIEERGDMLSARASTIVGVGFVLLGALTPMMATARYLKSRRALLNGQSVVPGAYPAVVLGVTVAVGGAILAVLLLL